MLDHSDPLEQYSSTMAKFGDLVHAPRNMTMLGCLSASMAAHQLKKSLTALSDQILNILIATVVSLHNPLQIMPQPPSEIWLQKMSSQKSISMLQLNTLGCTPSQFRSCSILWKGVLYSGPQMLFDSRTEPPLFLPLSYSALGFQTFWPLSRKVVLLPATICTLSQEEMVRRRGCGVWMTFFSAIAEIWPWELSPQPQSPLLSERAKKVLVPDQICLMLENFSSFLGVSAKHFSPSRQYSPIWQISPFLVRIIAFFSQILSSTASSPQLSEVKLSKTFSPIVPTIHTLPPQMQPVLQIPTSNLSIFPDDFSLNSVNQFSVLVLPVPSAYFSPQPQLNSLPLLVRTTVWRGPQAVLITTSSCASKNTGFSQSSALEARGLQPVRLVMLASSGRSSLLLRFFFLHSLRVSAKKLALGFLVPPGRREWMRTGFLRSSQLPNPNCPFRLNPKAQSSPLAFWMMEWQAPQYTAMTFISLRAWMGVGFEMFSLSCPSWPQLFPPYPQHQFLSTSAMIYC